jgi:hypothetical protein
MLHNLHPKCANPSCISVFDWLTGGKFFRFHRNPDSLTAVQGRENGQSNSHHVEHFWLCERCSRIYTLDHDPDKGVLMRMLWPELPEAKDEMRLPVD